MRKKEEVLKAENEVFEKVWYDRHQLGMKGSYKKEKDPKVLKCIQRGIKVAEKIEKKYGKGSLGPHSDFDWGMINGKLSTIRWMLGDEWDMLDT